MSLFTLPEPPEDFSIFLVLQITEDPILAMAVWMMMIIMMMILANFYWPSSMLRFSHSSDGKIRLQCRRPGFDSWVQRIPWRRKWQPTPVFLPKKFHGPRSLMGYSPWGLVSRVRYDLATKPSQCVKHWILSSHNDFTLKLGLLSLFRRWGAWSLGIFRNLHKVTLPAGERESLDLNPSLPLRSNI